MPDYSVILMMIVFPLTIFVMLWRPYNLNETVPTTVGALIILFTGIVSWSDLSFIFSIVSGPALTILSTIMMSIVLDSIGFFRWSAVNIVKRSNGSGVKLFFHTNLLCFFMTMFFNNDGSILITTPIIIHIMRILKLKAHQMFPYLVSGALIATAASAPIAVSNISNLISLKIIGLSLNEYVSMLFVPAMVGIGVILLLLYMYFKKDIPKQIISSSINWNSENAALTSSHPLDPASHNMNVDWKMVKICLLIVITTRAGFFALSPLGISLEWIGLGGAIIIIALRWFRSKTGISDILKKTPWHILLFAFNMYVLIYGLKNVGLTDLIVTVIRPLIDNNPFNATFIMGSLLTLLSNLFNNLPSVMIGTLTITEMELGPGILQVAYLANVIGSDIGALLTPIGTLATLIWMYILRSHSIKITWAQYLKVTIIIVPVGLVVSLLSFYLWIEWLFY